MSPVSSETHRAIMRAVKTSRHERGQEREFAPGGGWFFRFGVGFALVSLICTAVWQVSWKAQSSKVDANAALVSPALSSDLQSAWAFLGELSDNAPVALTKPLQNQLDVFSTGVTKKTKSLLASLPQPPVSRGREDDGMRAE